MIDRQEDFPPGFFQKVFKYREFFEKTILSPTSHVDLKKLHIGTAM